MYYLQEHEEWQYVQVSGGEQVPTYSNTEKTDNRLL